jgi:aspartyl-tRNA(Asn)/glutamyl-tRNA(Gln) amidotransferase subunit C
MSVSSDDVKKLANLARIELQDAEVEKLRGEIESILQYVDAVQKVPMPEGVAASPHLDIQNVMRDDGTPHETGKYTAEIVAQFPNEDENFLKVKKILGDR